jgi:hypothetical protein
VRHLAAALPYSRRFAFQLSTFNPELSTPIDESSFFL